jgi:hypothetical protein
MAKYKIWVDEENSKEIICDSKEKAIEVFDNETKRANEEYGWECMTVAEMLEEEPDADFDDLIEGCDFVYCEKIESEEEG